MDQSKTILTTLCRWRKEHPDSTGMDNVRLSEQTGIGVLEIHPLVLKLIKDRHVEELVINYRCGKEEGFKTVYAVTDKGRETLAGG